MFFILNLFNDNKIIKVAEPKSEVPKWPTIEQLVYQAFDLDKQVQ